MNKNGQKWNKYVINQRDKHRAMEYTVYKWNINLYPSELRWEGGGAGNWYVWYNLYQFIFRAHNTL